MDAIIILEKNLVVISSNKPFVRHFMNMKFNQSNGGTITHELGHAIANLPDTTGENCKMSSSSKKFCQSCQGKLAKSFTPPCQNDREPPHPINILRQHARRGDNLP